MIYNHISMEKTLFFGFVVFAMAIVGCKKDDSSGSNNVNTTPTQTMFYVTQDCGVGNISVTINGATKVITGYYTSAPDCGASSSANFDLSSGSYSFSAAASNMTWSGNITVAANTCNKYELTCGGNNNGVPSSYNSQGTITVRSQNLRICVRDFSTIDGDKIDVVINGTTYLSNYTITGTDRCFNVTLPKGNSWIGIIARDEGSISPCTPGITIDDGHTSQDFEIRSYVGGTNGAYTIQVSL